MVMFVLALVVIMAFAAVVIDLGLLRTNSARLQNALDAGVLAGSQQLPATGTTEKATVTNSVTQYVLANYPSAKNLTITYYCLVPAEIVSNGLVTDTSQLNIYCPNFPATTEFACSGAACDALCNPAVEPSGAPPYEGCDMLGATAYDTQPFYFGQFVGVPSGTINGGGSNGNPTSYAANLPTLTPVDVVLIMDRTQSMVGVDDQNAQDAAESIVEKSTWGGPVFDPKVQELAFGMLGPSAPSKTCYTTPASSGGSGDKEDGPAMPNATNLPRWVPVGLSGALAPASPAGGYASSQDYSAVLAAIECFTNTSLGTDLADPVAMARWELDNYGTKGHRQGIILETDGQANETDSTGLYTADTPCANAVTAATAARNDTTISSSGIEVYTVGFGLDGSNNTGNECSETGSWSNATPRSVLVTMASQPAADNTCNTADENTPIYYNASLTTYEYVDTSGKPYLTDPAGMTEVATAPTGSGWVQVTDHFYCVAKTSAASGDLTSVFEAVASSLASGSHLIALPVPPPIITSISPTGGPDAGGTTVTVYGKYLTSVYAVTVGGSTFAPKTVVSDTQLTFASPAGSKGAVNVTVTNPSGTSNAVTFAYP
jgi:hypothetical protein